MLYVLGTGNATPQVLRPVLAPQCMKYVVVLEQVCRRKTKLGEKSRERDI